MMRSVFLAIAVLSLTSASQAQQAPTPPTGTDGEAFVAAFGDVCIPQRLSYKGTLALAEELGWRPVVTGENDAYDRFIEHSDKLLADEIAEEPDLLQGFGDGWFSREIGGRSHLLAVTYFLSEYMDSTGCYLYDFEATAPIDPEPVSRLLGREIAYSTDGDDPMYAADPALLVTTVWGPPPDLPRTGDTYLTFIPERSPAAEQTGFTGLMIKFSTSLPDREEFQE